LTPSLVEPPQSRLEAVLPLNSPSLDLLSLSGVKTWTLVASLDSLSISTPHHSSSNHFRSGIRVLARVPVGKTAKTLRMVGSRPTQRET